MKTYRLDEQGALVPCDWGHHVERVPLRGPLDPAFGVGAFLDVAYTQYTRHEYHRAVQWTRHERRTLARRGTRGRRGARRVPAIHRDEVHVYLPEGAASDAASLLAQLDALFGHPFTP